MDEFVLEVYFFAFIIALAVGFIITIIMLVRGIKFKKKLKGRIISLGVHIVLGVAAGVYNAYHPTSLKYCDKLIIGHSIEEVRERYGDFDQREVREGEKGMVGYYDHDAPMSSKKQYYWIYYDENGTVTGIECGGNKVGQGETK